MVMKGSGKCSWRRGTEGQTTNVVDDVSECVINQ